MLNTCWRSCRVCPHSGDDFSGVSDCCAWVPAIHCLQVGSHGSAGGVVLQPRIHGPPNQHRLCYYSAWHRQHQLGILCLIWCATFLWSSISIIAPAVCGGVGCPSSNVLLMQRLKQFMVLLLLHLLGLWDDVSTLQTLHVLLAPGLHMCLTQNCKQCCLSPCNCSYSYSWFVEGVHCM